MPSTVLDYTLSNTPPAAISPGDFAGTGDESAPIELPALDPSPPGAISPGDFTPTESVADPIVWGGGASALPPMPSSFTPAFIELTGVGTALSALNANAADAAAGRIVQGVVNGELKHYQVRAGNDAQALPGIVRPANFHADTNAVVFVSL